MAKAQQLAAWSSPPAALAVLLLALQVTGGSSFSGRRSLSQQQPTCGISALGYSCYLQVCPSIQLHWSLGGPPPGPGCQYPNGTAANIQSFDTSTDLIHFALATDLQGYVALSLPQKLGVMAPADAIIGLYGGDVNAYQLKDHHTFPVDPAIRLQNQQTSGSNSQGLTVCASRQFAAVGGAGGALTLDAPVGMNFVAFDQPELKKHRMDAAYRCSLPIWLKATATAGAEHSTMHMNMDDARPAVIAHAVLMVVSWLLLLPAGVLAARHKWLFPETTAKTATWFIWHRTLQLTGTICFGVAFALPWLTFAKHDHGGEEGGLPKVHMIFGISLACIAAIQLLLALLRPKPEADIRRWWNLQHWYTGRLAIVLASANIIIGIQIFHEDWQVSRIPWYAVIIVLAGAAAGTAIWLEVQKQRRAEYTLATTRPEIGLGDRRRFSSGGGQSSPGNRGAPANGVEKFPLLHSR